jgi:putative sigma-54 modulation protein
MSDLVLLFCELLNCGKRSQGMQIIIKGKQMEVTPRLREHIERKVQRLVRLVDEEARVEVTVTEEQTRSARDRYSVQLTLACTTHPVRSEVSAVNANMALDLVLDKVMTQLGRYKDRQTTTVRHRTPAVKILSLSRSGSLSPLESTQDEVTEARETVKASKQAGATAAIRSEQNEEIWSRVVEIRRMPTKPMDDQEVIAQMEMLGLAFFPFFNEETNSVNVMYRLDKGGYGLLVPELD